MENLGLGHGHGQKGHSVILFCGKNFNFTILIAENFNFAHGHGQNFDHSIIAF